MFSNTANNSASDSVNTRPKLNAYLTFIAWFKNNDQKIALAVGYILVAALFFGLGQFSAYRNPPDIRIEEPNVDLSRLNNIENLANSQTGNAQGTVAGESTAGDCGGKIKGNISAKAKIYHMPGGAFYNRTVPEACFDTEAEAIKAGFRKSKS